ncbi:C-type lectin mannose-binding isoform-like [Argopecten irradians]|uniref:C-type lectin mannose-binding isoform-like n=1 Tax=Argopecten irradians TaxID=31199 RepID=UPI0037112441
MCVTLTTGTNTCVIIEPWCPTYIGGRCYRLSEDRATWEEAKLNCEANSSTLARIDSADLLMTLSNGLPKDIGVYIGGSDRVTEGQWVWAYGNVPINFTGIPHFLNIYREHQDCLMIKFANNTATLQDTPCVNDKLYICQSSLVN